MHPAGYVFGSGGIVNQTGGWNTGIAFLFGLLSVQWTVSDSPFRVISYSCPLQMTVCYECAEILLLLGLTLELIRTTMPQRIYREY